MILVAVAAFVGCLYGGPAYAALGAFLAGLALYEE